jgi:hypothetical protein
MTGLPYGESRSRRDPVVIGFYMALIASSGVFWAWLIVAVIPH